MRARMNSEHYATLVRTALKSGLIRENIYYANIYVFIAR